MGVMYMKFLAQSWQLRKISYYLMPSNNMASHVGTLLPICSQWLLLPTQRES